MISRENSYSVKRMFLFDSEISFIATAFQFGNMDGEQAEAQFRAANDGGELAYKFDM